MSDDKALDAELKELIVKTLALEDMAAAEIETDAPLFGDGLDLDSIDALEIAMVLEERYGVTLDDDPDKNQEIFESVRNLADFVAEKYPGIGIFVLWLLFSPAVWFLVQSDLNRVANRVS